MLSGAFRDLVSKVRPVGRMRLKKGLSLPTETVEDQAQAFRIWAIASLIGFLALSVAIMLRRGTTENSDAGNSTHIAGSTFDLTDKIPDDRVLVPIEPANLEALDSILDQFATVDLYSPQFDGQRGSKIIAGVPLLRAPRNPRQFAVMVSEDQLDNRTMGFLSGPVIVAIRSSNRKAVRTESRTLSKRPHPSALAGGRYTSTQSRSNNARKNNKIEVLEETLVTGAE